MAIVMSLQVNMQEENTLEQTNVNCHVSMLLVKLVTNVQPKPKPHNIIEHRNASMLVSTSTSSVMRLH
jgi:hypothetical protein